LVIAAARLAAASRDNEQIQLAVDSLQADAEFARAGLTSLFSELSRHDSSFADSWAALSIVSQRNLDGVLEAAHRDAADPKQSDTARCEAIDLLAVTDGSPELLMPLALHDPQQPVRMRAIAALAKSSDLKPWQQILASYANETPALRSVILDGTLARPERIALLFDELAAGHIQPRQLGTNHVNRLLTHRDKAIQARAKELFAASIPQDRQRALADYRPVLAMKADPQRGRGIFAKQCATCHRIGDVGVNVAPDISDSREKSSEQLLTDILQPNRAIDANYFSYTATTSNGVTHTGILAAETSTSITLREAEGKTITLHRDEIDELASSGVSLMPEGLERLIPPQDMADLVSFIKNWRYLDESPIVPAPAR
jgi:putative heme-binding domain-containing protein